MVIILNNIYNIINFILFSLGYGFYNYYKNNFVDIWNLLMMSLIFGLGVLCLIKSFQYLFLLKKTNAKILNRKNSAVNTGKIQDIGSYSKGYKYNFLINGEKYTMPKYFEFGSKYEIGDIIKVSIIDNEKKIAIPIRAVYNIIIIGFVSIYISSKIAIS